MTLATFTWSVTIRVPDGFAPDNPEQAKEALNDAWGQVQKGDGEIMDLFDEPPDQK